MTFYFVTTEHLETGVWFRDDEDFKVGMNYVAIEADITGVNVLAFVLMSNHVHFNLECTYEEAQFFITDYKRRYSIYYRSKYGIKEFLRGNGVSIQEVPLDGESLERSLAYTLMNAVAANICINCGQYPWGSGSVYFNPQVQRGVPVSSLSLRQQKNVLRSSHRLPDTYILGEDGYILPSSYVKVGFVESVFRKPSRMNYFLQNSSKAKIRLASDDDIPAFRDQSILSSIPDLCYSLFKKGSVTELSLSQKAELLKQLRRRFSADLKQLARVTGIGYSEAADLLEAF